MIRALAILLCTVGGLAAAADERPARVGMLGPSHGIEEPLMQNFVAAMRDLGWVEGRTVQYLDRPARGKVELLPALAQSLVQEGVDVIVAPPTIAAAAARGATRRIPIVFLLVSDPVGAGLVESLARPGGNATGLYAQTEGISAKMVEFLAEALPGAKRIAVLANPANTAHEQLWIRTREAATEHRLQAQRIDARRYDELEGALTALRAAKPDGILVLSDPIFVSRRELIVRALEEARIPAIYAFGEFAEIGGLMAYGVDLRAQFRRAAATVDRILRGADPATIPVEQPTRFELTVNVKAAERIGVKLPREFLLRADRVLQ